MKKSVLLLALSLSFVLPVSAKTLFLIGDDTLASHKKRGEDPRTFCLGSWGDSLERWLASGAHIVNLAGVATAADCRSSGEWANALARVKAGDTVLLGFSDVEALASCVADVRAKKGGVVLVTPLAEWSGTGDMKMVAPAWSARVAAVRRFAVQNGVDMIDMAALSQAEMVAAGPAEAVTWFRAVEDGKDGIHPTHRGADIFARAFLRDGAARNLAVARFFRPILRTPMASGKRPPAAETVVFPQFVETETAHVAVRLPSFAARVSLAPLDGETVAGSRRLLLSLVPTRPGAEGRLETGFVRLEFNHLAEGRFVMAPRLANGVCGPALVLAQNRIAEIDTSRLAENAVTDFEIAITPWNKPLAIAVVPGAETLDVALKKVADIRKRDTLTPIELRLAPGDYPLAPGLTVTRAHARAGWAPLTLVAADATHRPRLLGGTPVTGWQKTSLNGRQDVWVADVSALGLPARNKLFFYNGHKMEAARWPNLDPRHPYTTGFAFATAKTKGTNRWNQQPDGMFEDEIPRAATDQRTWSNPAEGWVIVFPRHNWWNRSFSLTNVTATGVMKLACAHKPITDRLFIWDRWCVMGVREELDAPGEWYFDRAAGRLYFITPDGSDPRDGVTTVARAPQILKVEDGVANVVLESLEVTGGNAGISLNGANDVAVQGCAIHDIGFINGDGVDARGSRLVIADNDIWNIGGHGISLSARWPCNRFTDRSDNVARNNYIHHVGQVYSHGIGIIMSGQGVAIHHNYIHDTPRCGLFGYGRFCDIAYNRVRHTNTINDDTGAIYGGGWTGGQGTTVRFNRFSDSIGFQRAGDGTYKLFKGACGIYPDEGCGGLQVYGNLVEHCHHVAMHLHNGRWITISNNVFISNASLPTPANMAQLSLQTWNNQTNQYFVKVRQAAISKEYHSLIANDSRWLSFPSLRQAPDRDDLCYNGNGTTMMGVKVLNNIFSYPDQGGGLMLRSGASLQLATIPFDYNLYWPGQTTNIVQRSGKDMNWEAWRAAGEDVHSRIADPCFVNPSANDWRLRPESPAHALGFKDLPYDKMGLEKTRLRPVMPQEAEGLREHPEWLQP